MLDFTNIQKKYLKIILADGSEISIAMPKKKMFTMLMELREGFNNANLNDLESIDTLYEVSAGLLSNNRANKIITADELAELWDVEDIQIFFNAYIAFVTGKIESDPN